MALESGGVSESSPKTEATNLLANCGRSSRQGEAKTKSTENPKNQTDK